MPQITLPCSPQGLILDALIWVSLPRKIVLEQNNQPVPNAMPIRALVDTGATSTVIDKAMLAQLGMPPIGTILIHTPSTGQNAKLCLQYDIGIFIPGHLPGAYIYKSTTMAVIESDFSSHGGGYNALLGLDVLRNAILHFNGEASTFTLCF